MQEQPYLYHEGDNSWVFIQSQKAEKYFDDYWNAVELMDSVPVKAESKFKKIIKNCGNGHVDAILHLGLLYNDINKPIEGNALIHKAHLIALHAIPNDFNKEHDTIIWSILENRPFLRTYHAVGLEYMNEGQYEKAIEKFNFVLSVNKWDSQGVRYLLPECFLYLKKYHEFIKLYNELLNSSDEGHSIEYDFALFYALYKLGEFDKAKEQFKIAQRHFPNVALELMKDTHAFPYDEFDRPLFGIPMGSKQEAFDYWNRTKKLWVKEKKMQTFIKKISV